MKRLRQVCDTLAQGNRKLQLASEIFAAPVEAKTRIEVRSQEERIAQSKLVHTEPQPPVEKRNSSARVGRVSMLLQPTESSRRSIRSKQPIFSETLLGNNQSRSVESTSIPRDNVFLTSR